MKFKLSMDGYSHHSVNFLQKNVCNFKVADKKLIFEAWRHLSAKENRMVNHLGIS